MSIHATEAARTLLATVPILIQLTQSVLQREQPDALTAPQLRALEQLAGGPLTATELARRRRVALASMGELVQALVERGLVVRQPNPADRRQQLLHLTDEGQRRHIQAFTQLHAQLAAALSAHMQTDEVETLASVLPMLHRALGAELATRDS